MLLTGGLALELMCLKPLIFPSPKAGSGRPSSFLKGGCIKVGCRVVDVNSSAFVHSVT